MVERKIRIGAVSYLNTKPFLYGLENSPLKNEITLTLDYPSNLVKLLKNGQIDLGLVPVGALPSLGEYHIVSDYCIGTEGEVASVAVFSEVPIEHIETVYLDYQSKTSVLLCKLLFEKHWNKKVTFIEATDESYIGKIKGTTAGLIIGDRALMNIPRFKYVYDLGLGWKSFTGLPFVFAVWVSKSVMQNEFMKNLNYALQSGLTDLEKVIVRIDQDPKKLKKYFTENISYYLSQEKLCAIEKFIELS